MGTSYDNLGLVRGNSDSYLKCYENQPLYCWPHKKGRKGNHTEGYVFFYTTRN